MELRRWIVLKTYGTLSQNGHRTWPSARRCHGLVQYTDEDGTVYAVISGGYNGTDAFGDVWKIDLSTMQWTCLTSCVLPSPIYFHSASITPQGQMFIFGGIVQQRDSVTLTNLQCFYQRAHHSMAVVVVAYSFSATPIGEDLLGLAGLSKAHGNVLGGDLSLLSAHKKLAPGAIETNRFTIQIHSENRLCLERSTKPKQ